MSPREIDGCIVEFYRHQDVVNTRFGTICATLVNVQPSGKRKKLLDWTNFFRPITARKTKKQSLEELQAEFMASHEALSGAPVKKKQ